MLGERRRHLLAKGYGNPLCNPELSDVRIGDVGHFTDASSFRYFFNIRFPRDDPANSFLRDPVIEADTLDFKTVTTMDSNITLVATDFQEGDDGQVGEPQVGNPAGICASSDVGAASLPKGICSETLPLLEPFRKHVLDYGGAWFEFMLKWGHPAGEPLYLITGCVKSSLPSQNEAIPSSRAAFVVREPSKEGQCVFLRGYMIQKRRIPLIPEPVVHSSPEVPPIERSPEVKRSLMRRIWSLFTSCWRDTSISPRSNNPLSHPDQRPCLQDTSFPRNNGLFHPSKFIIEHIFATFPDATFAIVHDDEWMSVLRPEDTGRFPDNREIVERVFKKYNVEMQSGRAFFTTPQEDTARLDEPGTESNAEMGPSSQMQNMIATPKATASNGTGTVFALIIGNNDYLASDEYGTLQGCVNDARAFEKYLLDPRTQKGLQVPPSNIVVLENARRVDIISTFKSHLLENRNIPDHGEATMILFYAGHGTRIAATDNIISTDGKVEAIAPVDERTMDADGKYVHAIPDYILGWLLWELSRKKGPNITVILDSCFSGGMGRDSGKARRSGKSLSLPIPLDLDNDLWEGKTETAMSRCLWSPSATSHVLLAACREDETAWEISYSHDSIHGRFTESLITWLRRVPLENTTYVELLNCLPVWPGQTPHCVGSRRNQLVFNGNYPATGRRAVPLTPEAKFPQSFRVDIGTVEGVIVGTEFAIHAGDNSLLCTLVAESVQIGHSILIAKDKPITIPEGSRAVVSDWKNEAMVLHVYLPSCSPYMSDLFPTANTYQAKGHKYRQAQSPETADILVRPAGQKIVIEHLRGTMIECQRETWFSLNGNTAHLPAVLDGIAHFNYFLERHHGSDPLKGVALEMHHLEGRYPGRKPDRSVGLDGNIVVNDEVRLSAQADAKYGFTIRNTSPADLFPYLFFFDPDMYTIKCWYSPVSVHDAAPLKKEGGVVTVGMGSEPAFHFPGTLPPGVSSSFAFLKLFVSTQHLDLEWIQQETPFDPEFQGTGRLVAGLEPFTDLPWWDSLKVILTLTAG
ncbi:caspase domain-containing protein [Mycena galericulata]|nr:caspase domain-containing protein [Mycena galericulata]